MKSIKPIMLVVAGMAIAFLVSFKSQEPVKEYASIEYYYPLGGKIKVYTDKVKEYPHNKSMEIQSEINTILNSLSAEGWNVVSETSGLHSNRPFDEYVIRLERTKQ